MTPPPSLTIDRSLTRALKQFDADRLRWLDEAAAIGPIVALRMGPIPTWIVTDPEVARTMLLAGTAWRRPPGTLTPIRLGVGENLFTQSDKAWANLQPAVAPAFRKSALEARLADMDALIADEVHAIPLDTTVDLELAMGRIALILAAWVLLGERLDSGRAEEIALHQRDVVSWVGEQLGRMSGGLPIAIGARGRTMKRRRAVLNAYADEVIARAKAAPRDGDDVLGALMGARPAGKPLAPNQLRGHVLGLFLAGNETTAAALAWALVHGARSPDEWRRVRDEPERLSSPFVMEALRLNPAVWGIPRTPTKAGTTVTSGEVTVSVRRGIPVIVYIRGINRDEKVWVDPLRFDPARHLASGPEQHRALLPFGLGPRGCIGQHLAMAELNAVLPALARHGDVEIVGTPSENPAFALRVTGGLHGCFTASPPRNP